MEVVEAGAKAETGVLALSSRPHEPSSMNAHLRNPQGSKIQLSSGLVGYSRLPLYRAASWRPKINNVSFSNADD